MKLITSIVLFAFLATSVIAGGVFLYYLANRNFACAHPKYEKIVNGLTKDQVIHLLGRPDKKTVKQDMTKIQFWKGEWEQKLKIKEEWVYKLWGYSGTISVYFDINGIVVLKGCGEC